ncbi:MAG: thioredoxin-disulfide reductase [Planctomycetes bacterium]|nr:thioredoxin-disulfide reductase [Planctomycetota bacterium]
MRNVIIIGSGPAGFTAAIYASRANLQPLLFEGDAYAKAPEPQAGGQLMITTEVENYPGFPDGVEGPDLMEKMRAQAKRFGTECLEEVVTKVDFSKRPFRVWVGETLHEAKAIIIATGARARYLGLPSELKFYNRGVSACATCDGFAFKGKEIVVVGGGDSAMEEGNYLTKFATKLTLVHRREEFRASKIMLDRLRQNPKVAWKLNKEVLEIFGDDRVRGVRLKDTKTGAVTDYKTDGVFLAIGHEPNTKVFQGQVALDEKGYVKLEKHTHTSVEGVFASGDVSDSRYRQAVTAAGTGCAAAIDCERWLEEHP